MKLIKNKKRFLIIFIFVSAMFFIVFGLVLFYNAKIESAKKKLLNNKFFVKNIGCVIKTFGRNSESVSASISFYKPGGKLIKSYERSWKGWELSFECIVLNLETTTWVFPYRVFSDKTKYGTGTLLFNYYSVEGFPAIYDYRFSSVEERNAISVLFKLAKFSPYLFKLFSGAETRTINLREFKADKEYSLLINNQKQVYLKKN